MAYENNKGADQPAHPRSLISAFVGRCLDSIISLDSIAEILRLVSFCGCAGWFVSRLAWWETPEDMFSCVMAHIYELPHDTINKITCAPSEDSAQPEPGHTPSLISLHCLHEEILGPYLGSLGPSEDWSDWANAQFILLVLSSCGSNPSSILPLV